MRKPRHKYTNPSDDFVLHKENSDILPLEELKKRIFLKACEYYRQRLDVVAQHLQIGANLALYLKEQYSEKAETDISNSHVDNESQSIGFYNLAPALSNRFEMLQDDGNFRSMPDMLGEIADRAMERYKSKFLAARRLGIEEDELDSLLERDHQMFEDATNDESLSNVPEEGLSGKFNPHGLNLFNKDGHIITWKEAEASLIEAAINHYPNITEVARRLGMGRSTLYRKIEDYNLRQP